MTQCSIRFNAGPSSEGLFRCIYKKGGEKIWKYRIFPLSLQKILKSDIMAAKKIVASDKDYTNHVSKAVKFFWNTKKRQLKNSGDASNRGAVVGG